jgi:hypothetical protein
MAISATDKTAFNLLVDDDGSGTVGSVVSKATINSIYVAVDNLLSNTSGMTIAGPFFANSTITANGTLTANGASIRGTLFANGAVTVNANFATIGTVSSNGATGGFVTYDRTAGVQSLTTYMASSIGGLYHSQYGDVLTVNSIGCLTVPAGQIAFPATQNPSSGANVLDDYEEGTWTPTFSGTIGNATVAANYIKVGKKVSFRINVVWGSTTSCGAGTAQSFTLPFTAGASGICVGSGLFLDSGTGFYTCVCYLSSSTTVAFYNCDGFQSGQVVGASPFTWTTSDQLIVSGTYDAAA